jgi:ATP-dependent Lon protease
VESSLSKGKGILTITGNLGDVMKESAMLALEYLKSHAAAGDRSGNVPGMECASSCTPGAIPKDGPSAGVTMVTALASAFTGEKVKRGIAMTGEIT